MIEAGAGLGWRNGIVGVGRGGQLTIHPTRSLVDSLIRGVEDIVLVNAAAQEILLLLGELPLSDLLGQGHKPGGVARGDRIVPAGGAASLPAKLEEGEVEAATVS